MPGLKHIDFTGVDLTKTVIDFESARDMCVPALKYRNNPVTGGVWVFDHKGCRKVLGGVHTMSVSEARRIVVTMLSEGVESKFRVTQNLSDLFEEFMAGKEMRKSHDYRLYFFNNTPKSLLDKRLELITAANLRHVFISITSKGTANYWLKIVKAIMNFAMSSCILSENPAAYIKMHATGKRTGHITPDEIASFVDYLEHEKCDKFVAFIKLLLFTGVRKNNLITINMNDVDFENNTWTINAGASKSGKLIKIAVLDRASNILRELQIKYGDRPFFGLRFDRQWQEFRIEAGYPNLLLHDLRRTFATVLYDGGAQDIMVSKALGHQSVRMTNRYVFVQDKAMLNTVEKSFESHLNCESQL